MSAPAVLEWNGRALTVAEWAKELGCDPRVIRQRLKYGWTLDRVLGEPVNENMRGARTRRSHLRLVKPEREPLCTKRLRETGDLRCVGAECGYHLEHRGDVSAGAKAQHESRIVERIRAGFINTCAIDLANRGSMTLDEIAVYLGVTPERARQIEEKALRKLERSGVKMSEFRAWQRERGERR